MIYTNFDIIIYHVEYVQKCSIIHHVEKSALFTMLNNSIWLKDTVKNNLLPKEAGPWFNI